MMSENGYENKKETLDDLADSKAPPSEEAVEESSLEVYSNVLPHINNSLFKPPNDEKDAEKQASEGLSKLVVDIAKLPPLLPPQLNQQVEVATGTVVVVTMCLVLISLTHGIALEAIDGIEKRSPTWWTFLIMIYTEAFLALVCLVGLRCSDPGVIHRSPATCFPVPLELEYWVQAHLDGKERNVDKPTRTYIAAPNAEGGTYCVRCMVWRKPKGPSKVFHCHTCNRCVEHFDHHCGVFGRCVAGGVWKGNYKYFVTIITVAVIAIATTLTSLLWSLSARYRPGIVIPVFLGGGWFLLLLIFRRCCYQLCLLCQNLWNGFLRGARSLLPKRR